MPDLLVPMADNIVHKNSFYSRENVWKIFDQRCLSCPSWIVQDISSSTSHGINSPDFLSLAYLYYAFRERMAYDIVTEMAWGRWYSKRTALDSGAVQECIISKENDVPAIWFSLFFMSNILYPMMKILAEIVFYCYLVYNL